MIDLALQEFPVPGEGRPLGSEPQAAPETPAPVPARLLDPRQIEVMDPDMVPVLRRKTPAERLQNSFAIWESACSMLQAHLSHTHRDWTPERVRREVAHRMSHGAV